jgi:hypothetical protein
MVRFEYDPQRETKAAFGQAHVEGFCDRKFGNLAMIASRSYYVMATRQTAYPPSWRWRIVRRGEPMGVRIEGGGLSSYHAARLAGGRALANFLEQVELEKRNGPSR